MISRLKPNLSIREIISASCFWKKDSVELFEKNFAELMQAKYALAFPYGRTALVLGLEALGISKKEIICPAYTCVVVAHAIMTSDNMPVFVDSEFDSFNMDWHLVEAAINENTGAIIATSIFGYPVDLDAIKYIKKKYPHIKIIQDCAHSFSAEWGKEPVQNIGDFAIYGLNISKIMTSIFGGMVTTNDEELYKRLLEIRNKKLNRTLLKPIKRWLYLIMVFFAFNRTIYGLVNKCERLGILNKYVKYYDESKIDMPADYLKLLSSVEARVGIIQCKKYQKIIAHKKEIAGYYYQYLKQISEIILPKQNEGATYSHFVIQTSQAKEIIKYFLKHKIQLGSLIDYHIPSMKTYENARYLSNNLSEKWPDKVINLPIHSHVTLSDVQKIVSYLEAYYDKNI